jgi:hypothetical protein
MGTGFTVFAYLALAVWGFASLYAVGLWVWLSLPRHWRLRLTSSASTETSDSGTQDSLRDAGPSRLSGGRSCGEKESLTKVGVAQP